jgi:hypothetical protein
MGVHKNISYDKYPKQSDNVGKSVLVCFCYNTNKYIDGVIVRDDREDPWTTLIKLIDDRYVNATECQYKDK